jgi:DNA-binding response OmpR family regulator
MTSLPPVGKHVLIVDDSVEYLNFMQLLLAEEGFRADTAPTTDALQHQLLTALPDLVISDVRMPGQDAFAVLDLLHADARTATIPVLLCTGAVQEVEEQADRLKQQGVEVLFKPFDVEELLSRVSRLCGLDKVAHARDW